MIHYMIITPLVCAAVSAIFRKKTLNLFLVALSAVVYATSAFSVCTSTQHWWYFETDAVSRIYLAIMTCVYLASSAYSLNFMKEMSPRYHTLYTAFLMLFIVSMTGAVLCTNLGLMWVFIEATTLFSVPFIYMEKSPHSLEAAWKYIFICSIGISFAFVGIIILLASMPNSNSLQFTRLITDAQNTAGSDLFWLKLSFVFLLVGLGTKTGLAPVHGWLPDAHSESPSPVSALLSGSLLNTALVGIIRIFRIMEAASMLQQAKTLFMIMGFLSVFVSAVFMLHARNYKRMLAYSSIENMGIIAIAVATGGAGIFAAMLHSISHSLSKTSLFLTSGNIYHITKTKKISEVSGLNRKDPITGWLWMAGFLSISAFPPFPSFLSELIIVFQMIKSGQYILAALFLFLLTIILYAMGNTIMKMCFGEGKKIPRLSVFRYAPQIIITACLIIIGLFIPGPAVQWIMQAASSM